MFELQNLTNLCKLNFFVHCVIGMFDSHYDNKVKWKLIILLN